jgi:YggT family protein
MGNVVLRNVTVAIASTLDFLLTMYWWLIIAGVVVSWVNADPYNPIVRFVRNVTEPVFHQVRKRLPFVVISGIDLSPIVVILLLEVVRRVLVVSLYELANRLAALPTGVAVG